MAYNKIVGPEGKACVLPQFRTYVEECASCEVTRLCAVWRVYKGSVAVCSDCARAITQAISDRGSIPQ